MRLAGALILVPMLCCCTERSQSDTRGSRAAVSADTVAEPQEQPSGDSLLVNYHANGTLKYLILAKDSGACRELHRTYYENGRLKSEGCQGTVENGDVSTGMSIGTWSYFDSLSGRLDSTLRYNNDGRDKAFIEKRSFYSSGGLKSVEIYNNYILYETEMIRKGVWKYYAEDGRLLRTEKH